MCGVKGAVSVSGPGLVIAQLVSFVSCDPKLGTWAPLLLLRIRAQSSRCYSRVVAAVCILARVKLDTQYTSTQSSRILHEAASEN